MDVINGRTMFNWPYRAQHLMLTKMKTFQIHTPDQAVPC